MGRSRDLTEFERGLIVGARGAGCSISDTVKLLGFSKTAVSRVYRDWCGKKKTRSQRAGGRKRFVDETQMERVVEANNRATVVEIQRLYNCTADKPISVKTTQRALKRLGYAWKTTRREPGQRKKGQFEGSSSADKGVTDAACSNKTQPETSLDGLSQNGFGQDALSQDGARVGTNFFMREATFCP